GRGARRRHRRSLRREGVEASIGRDRPPHGRLRLTDRRVRRPCRDGLRAVLASRSVLAGGGAHLCEMLADVREAEAELHPHRAALSDGRDPHERELGLVEGGETSAVLVADRAKALPRVERPSVQAIAVIAIRDGDAARAAVAGGESAQLGVAVGEAAELRFARRLVVIRASSCRTASAAGGPPASTCARVAACAARAARTTLRAVHRTLPTSRFMPLCSTGSAGADRRRAISSARAATCALSGSSGHGSSRRIPISKPPETWSSVRRTLQPPS